MAPKAAPPPPEPAAPPEDLFAAEEGEADVSDLVEELIARTHAVLDEKAELQRSVPFAVRAVTADMLSVVRCYYTECDRGEPQLATATSWSADAEPRPAMIDAWSRGAVPVKKRAPPPAPLVDASAPGSSVGGASRSQRSPRSSARPKSREAGKEDGAAVAVVTAKAPPKSTEAAAPAAKKGVATKTPQEERAARMVAEAREETERLERLRAEVKGREYTYDQMGNVIVIETVNPERLPAYQYATRAGMAHEPKPEPVKGKKGSRRPPPATTSVLRFNQPGKYEELDSLQPPLSESMTMREGVSMTQDGSLSSGALPSTAAHIPPTPPTPSPVHLRQQQRARASLPREREQGEGAACAALPPPVLPCAALRSLLSPFASLAPLRFTCSPSLHLLPGYAHAYQTDPASRPPPLPHPAPTHPAGPTRAVDPSRMSKKDFESFVQTASLAADVAAIPSNPVASQLEPSTPLPAIPPAGSEDYGDAAGILGGDTANDVNLQLMAKDWGVNPPQREVNSAKKPRSKPDTTQTLGLGRARLPRERGGTGVAEHLPPPLLPATAGWGLGSTFGGIPEEPGGGPPPLSGNAGSPIRTANPQLRQQVLGR